MQDSANFLSFKKLTKQQIIIFHIPTAIKSTIINIQKSNKTDNDVNNQAANNAPGEVLNTVNIHDLFSAIPQQYFSISIFRHLSRLLISVVQVYTRKTKYLLEDCCAIRTDVKRKQAPRSNLLKVLDMADIENELGGLKVGDYSNIVCKKLSMPSFIMPGLSFEDNLFNDSMLDLSEVEVVRDDSRSAVNLDHADYDLNNDFIINSSVLKNEDQPLKKRKIDNCIEYNSISDIKIKINKIGIKHIQNNKNDKDLRNSLITKEDDLSHFDSYAIRLPEEIVNFFSENLKPRRISIEAARNDGQISLLEYEPYISNIENSIHSENVDMYTGGIQGESEDYLESVSDLDNSILEKAGSSFVFNDYVESLSKKEKGKAFFELLRLCSYEKISCIQEESYSDIICSRIMV